MRYGDLEGLLVDLSGGEPRSVVGRFRNLRQIPFPDAIRAGTGNRVEYDLPRTLALCAVFEINALLMPQANAVAVVRDSWPELVRGFIAGAVELGTIPSPKSMPTGLSATVSILPDGFAPEGHPSATAANVHWGPDTSGVDTASDVRVDCAGLMATIVPKLTLSSGDADGAVTAFDDLDRSFGWSKGSVPHRATAADLFTGSSFLDRGPYLDRAAAFLRVTATLPDPEDKATPARRRSRQAAQNLLDYLGRPAPIDEWMGEIGTEAGRPRLKHYLAAIGVTAGLTPPVRWPETILATTGTASESAAALIEKALRVEQAARAERKRTVAS